MAFTLLIMKSVRTGSLSGMDICNLGQMALGLGMGWGEDVLPKGNELMFMGIRPSITYPGENNVVQVLWLPYQ